MRAPARSCALVLLLALPGQSTETPESMQAGVMAKPSVRPAPRYPDASLRQGREGWAHVSFMITPEGKVEEVLLEDSSGGREFGRAALRSVRVWTYEPATLGGEPVEQCSTDVLITFALDGRRKDRGATRPFVRRFKKLAEQFNNEDLPVIRARVDELDESAKNLYESSRVWALRALLAQREKKPAEQLRYVRRALAGNGEFLEPGLQGRLSLMTLALELKLQAYGEALETFARLEALEPKVEIPAVLASAVREIETRRDTGKRFKVSAKIGPANEDHEGQGVWRYKVVGRKPGIAEVRGELGRMELRCDFRRVVSRAAEGKAWRIPDEWGACWMYVYGDAGAQFSLVEYPRGSTK